MRDVVAASVAAYGPHVHACAADTAGLVADLAARFAAALPAGSRILDAGCGPGRDLARFVATGHRPVGVDLCPGFVALAARSGPVVAADLRVLPFADGTFGGVWACASLVHLSAVGMPAALRELVRVCVPGGLVYVSVKADGVRGWRETSRGRRWFEVWEPAALAEVAVGAELEVDGCERTGEWVDLWARRATYAAGQALVDNEGRDC